jgi:sugar lactone lactonase YvrE
MYEVEGMKEWLLDDGIDEGNVFAAYEFGLVPEGYRGEITETCEYLAQRVFIDNTGAARFSSWNTVQVEGVGANAVRGIVQVLVSCLGKRWWTRHCVEQCVALFVWWWLCNAALCSGCSPDEMDQIIDMMDFTKLSRQKFDSFLQRLDSHLSVIRCQGSTWASGVANKIAMDPAEGPYAGDFLISRIYDADGGDHAVWGVAVHGEGAEQRVAVVLRVERKVRVYNVESGQCLATMEDVRVLRVFCGVAFNTSGELFVSDHAKGQILVFDRMGELVRSFGERGSENGQFSCPSGLAFTPVGCLVVADLLNHRVQVLDQDGSFVSSFEPKRNQEDLIQQKDLIQYRPSDVAVGQDGTIYVTFPHVYDRGRFAGVQVFNAEGVFLRRIGTNARETRACGGLSQPAHVAVGGDGGIFICDLSLNHVLEFDTAGVHVQSFGSPHRYGGALHPVAGLAVDSNGRLFVGCHDGTVKMLV